MFSKPLGVTASAVALALAVGGCRTATPAGGTPPGAATGATGGGATGAASGAAPAGTSIAGRTSGMEKRDGFLPLYLDGTSGKLLLELPADSTRLLLFVSEATGLGSNPVGLDRGGEQVLVVFENWNYRSSLRDNAAHARTVAESFPPSTVAALPLVAREGERLLVDATDFFVRDWVDVAGTLAAARQGSYSLARERSGVARAHTRNFPRNTEVDVSLTFATTGDPGRTVQAIVPDGRSFTIRQHASLLPLPDSAYRPRELDPRVGFN